MDAAISILSTKKLSIKEINSSILVDSYDFIKILPLENKQEILYKRLIFTSINATKIAFTTYNLLNKDFSFFCVGKKTANYLVKMGIKVDLIENNAADLANKLIQLNQNSFTFFCSESHLNSLPTILELNKIPLQKIVLYKTISTSTKLNKTYNGYVFFSPSGLDSFLLENNFPENSQIFAIGYTTAKAINKKVKNNVIVASETSLESTLQSIKEYYTIC